MKLHGFCYCGIRKTTLGHVVNQVVTLRAHGVRIQPQPCLPMPFDCFAANARGRGGAGDGICNGPSLPQKSTYSARGLNGYIFAAAVENRISGVPMGQKNRLRPNSHALALEKIGHHEKLLGRHAFHQVGKQGVALFLLGRNVAAREVVTGRRNVTMLNGKKGRFHAA